MTPSPELLHELRASRPTAPAGLRARVRELAAAQPAAAAPSPWSKLTLRLPARRLGLVALPAAAALALTTAGVLGLARSDDTGTIAVQELSESDKVDGGALTVPQTAQPPSSTTAPGAADQAVTGATGALDRAQRVSATLTVEVADSDAVADSAQKALDLTRRLGGHVVSASVVARTTRK